jgi:hypothetical protein
VFLNCNNVFFQVDGAHALVQCQNKDAGEGLSIGKSDPASLLSDCRILRKDDLQVVKGLSAPKVPDCFQKTPKKIMVPENGQIQATAVDTQGKYLTLFPFVLFVFSHPVCCTVSNWIRVFFKFSLPEIYTANEWFFAHFANYSLCL